MKWKLMIVIITANIAAGDQEVSECLIEETKNYAVNIRYRVFIVR